jgi:hypothetical protein
LLYNKENTLAKVTVQVAGGDPQQKEAETVADLMSSMNLEGHTATVNGEPEDGSYELEDFEFVTFAKKVKAG